MRWERGEGERMGGSLLWRVNGVWIVAMGESLPRSARGAAVLRANILEGEGRNEGAKRNGSRRERRVWCRRWRDGLQTAHSISMTICGSSLVKVDQSATS